jgi:hypothetical protein
VRKKPKIHKVIDDGWEDFLRENLPASSSSIQITGSPTSVINPIKQRRHIKLWQTRRSHLLINCQQGQHGRQIKVRNVQPQFLRSQGAQSTIEDLYQRARLYTRIKTAKGMTKQQRRAIALDPARQPKAQRNRQRGSSDNYNKTYAANDNDNTSMTMLLSVQSNASISDTPLQHESDRDYEHQRTQNSATLDELPEDVVTQAMCPTTSMETRDDPKVTDTISREDAFSHKTGLTSPIGSTTSFTVASAGSSPTTEPVSCSQLTTDQQFAQILSLCQTSMTDTRGLCTTLSNDRDTQAQINMDLRNSIAKAHAAIDSLTSMLCKCPPKAPTIFILHHPIAQGSSVNPICGISSITNSHVEGPEQHEDEPTHDIASSETEFAQILSLCQTSITETRGIRTELSNGRDTQARINTDLRTSLAKAHAAIDALTFQFRK